LLKVTLASGHTKLTHPYGQEQYIYIDIFYDIYVYLHEFVKRFYVYLDIFLCFLA